MGKYLEFIQRDNQSLILDVIKSIKVL